MAEFEMFRPFHIDNDELKGLRPQECFVLGYELATIDELLKRPEPISRPVHSENGFRIREACEKSGRSFVLRWTCDISEMWMQLDVEATDAKPSS